MRTVKKIVILDDNFAIRNVLRTFLRRLGNQLDVEFKIYTSADGVEGLGYIYAADPDIIIVDTTLPKYSGKELLEFLTSNKKFSNPEKGIIVVRDDSDLGLKFPAFYTILHKTKRTFLDDLLHEVIRIVRRDSIVPKEQQQDGYLLRIAANTVFLANASDRILEGMRHSIFLGKAGKWLLWLAIQVGISIGLVLMQLGYGKPKDDNIEQMNDDEWAYRVRHFPTMAATLAASFVVLIQVFAYLASGLALLNLTGKVDPVSAAYSNGYSYRRAVTIDYTKVSGTSNLTNFPMVVNGTYSYLATTANGGKVENANGYDIIFTSDAAGTTKLDHEIEKYVATTGEVVMWVEVPSVSYTANTTIYLFYGNSSISATQENKTGVWDSNYRMVQHLHAGTTGNTDFKDSTSNANNSSIVTIDGAGSSATATGKIGTAVQFDGSNDKIAVADAASLDITSSWTISGWYKADTMPASFKVTALLAKTGNLTSEAAGTQINYSVLMDNNLYGSGQGISSVFENSTHADSANYVASATTLGQWYYLVGVFNDSGNALYTYRDGSQIAINSSVTAVPATNNYDLYIAVDNAANLSAYSVFFDGTLDEIRVSNTNRSAGWIGTEYNNQNSPSTFYSLGTEDASPTVTVSASGTQTTVMDIPSSNQYVGGMFVLSPAVTTATVTGITITENGTVDAQANVDNIKLFYELDTSNPYDCASESYAGTETQFGSTDTDGFSGANGTATFTGSVAVTTSQAMCVYAVLDIASGATNSQTLEIEISNPSTAVTLSSGSVTPATAVAISGATTLSGADTTVSTSGSQIAQANKPGTGVYIGGMFTITEKTSIRTVTGITIREQGSVDASTGLDNIKLYYEADTTAPYDCASESYAGTENQFGATDTDGFNGPNGTASFSSAVGISTTATLCVYVVVDVTSSATDLQTIEIDIADASTAVTVSSGTVGPATTVAISGSTSISAANWSNGYNYRRAITIDATKVSGSSNHTNFPFLVSGTYADLATTGNGGNVQNGSGYDIIFTSDAAGSTQLDHEIDRYVNTTGDIDMWVRIPSLSYSSDTTIYMFYGNSNIITSQENKAGLWTDYAGVWHMDENPAGTPPQLLDSTSTAENGTSNGSMTVDDLIDGVASGSWDFDRSNDYVAVAYNSELEPDTMTVSAWIKGTLGDNYDTIVSNRVTATTDWSHRLFFTDTDFVFTINVDGTAGGVGTALTPNSIVKDGNWHYVTGTYDGSNVRLFVDGIEKNSGSKVSAVLHDAGNDMWIGLQSTSSAYYGGAIDEVRVQSTPRSADWLLTEYNNQSSPSTFAAMGEEETGTPSVTVATTGSQISTVNKGTLGMYVGGAFVLTTAYGGTTVTGITISEQGTVNAQTGIDNIKLFYEMDTSAPLDCASEGFSGTETQFGSTDTDGFSTANGTSSFTGSAGLLQSQAMCVYVVLDITTSAGAGETLELQITTPSSEVTVGSGSVATGSTIAIAGTGTIATTGYSGNGYTYRRAITVDYTKAGGGGTNHTNFPMLVSGTYSYLATTGNGGEVHNANGYDIIFTSDAAGTTKLDHEIEKYVSTTGEVVMWVKVPTLSVTVDTTIYMFYGNASVGYSQEAVASLWSAYAGVWHLDEDPSGTAPQVIDYSTNAHHGTSNGTMTTGDLVTGQISTSLDFDGGDDYIAVPYAAALEPNTLTFSAWIKTSNSSQYRAIVSNRVASNDDYTYRMNFSGTSLAFTINTNGTAGGAASAVVASSSVADGTWHYVTGVYDSNAVYIFLDGTYIHSAAKVSAVLHDAGNDLWIGLQSTSTPYFLGLIDEVRLQSTPRFQAWLLAEYNNQYSPSTFYTVGSQTGEANVTVTSAGTQTLQVDINSTDNYLGGSFVLTTANGGTNVTGITITEQGSIDAQAYLDNIKLFYEMDTSAPYDCASESYAGTESQFGSTDTDGFSAANGTSSFSGSVALTTSDAMCVYVVTDVVVGAGSGDTIEVQITAPSSDVTVDSGGVSTGTAVAISGSTAATLGEYANGYAFRRSITIDYTKVGGSADLTNFPVLISGTYSYLATWANGGTVNSASGYDIIFTSDADGTTPLSHEIESYNPATGAIVMWVKLPTISYTANTTFYLFYSNSSVSASQENVANVWSNGYGSVYHFAEDPTGSAPQMLNSQTNTNQGTVGGTWSAGDLTTSNGNLGNGLNFDRAQTDRVSATDTHGGDIINVSGWVKGDQLNNSWETLAARADWDVSSIDWLYYLRASDGLTAFAPTWNMDPFDKRTSGTTVLSTATWYYLTLNYDGSNMIAYLNGVSERTTACASCTINDSNRAFWIGGNETWGEHFDGIIDEVHVSNSSRTGGWILTEYNNQFSPSTFYSVGTEVGGTASITLTTAGNQFSSLPRDTTSVYIGGAFVVNVANANTTITGITITEQGTVNAQTNLDNIKLFYELDTSYPFNCASESYVGTETQFGSTDIDGFSAANGTSAFTGSVALAYNQAMCVYVVLDIGSGASNGETLEIEVTTPGTDITIGSGSINTAGTVALAGTSTISVPNFANGYDYRRAITIDHTKVSTSNHTNFPFLFSGTYTYLAGTGSGGKVENANGYDIIFTSDADGLTQLDHEIDRYVSATGETSMWVRIPTLSYTVDTVIYIFYGNSAISVSQEDKNGVWDTNYKLVQHLEEGTTGNTDFKDSTTNANDSSSVTIDGAGSSATATGKIGRAVQFDGLDDKIVVSDAASLDITGNLTLSGWVNGSSGLPATLFSDGFESNNFSAWDATYTYGSGSQSTGTAYKYSGTYGALFSMSCASDCADSSYIQDNFTFPASNKIYATARVNFDSHGDYGYQITGSKALMSIDSGSGRMSWLIIADSGGSPSLRLAYKAKDGTDTFSGAEVALSIDTWYEVSMMIDKSGANPVVQWWLNGTSQSSTTDVTSGSSGLALTPSLVKYGIANISAWEKNTNSIWIDDVLEYDSVPTQFNSQIIHKGTDAYALQIDAQTPSQYINSSARATTTYTENNWHYIVGTYDSSNVNIYVDATAGSGSAYSTAIGTNATNITLGNIFDGIVDELRISSTARTAGWITTEYNNQNSPSTFYSEGTESTGDPHATVAVSGTQPTRVDASQTGVNLGGKFAIAQSALSPTVTGITITENGTIDAQADLDNIKLYYENDTSAPYDCASESYAGTESQFGATDTDGFSAANGTSTFTGSVAISSTSTMCVYVVMDIGAGAGGGETIEIEITAPDTDITLATGSVTTTSALAISGTTEVNADPILSSVSLNAGSDIDLTENTTTLVQLTATVTDANGYADITGVVGRAYRSGVAGAEACTLDDNNCYEESSSSLTSCAGNSCTATLSFYLEFHTDPTDAGTYSAEYWLGWIEATDSTAATGTGTSPTTLTDVNTLRAMNATSSIDYGALVAGGNTGATNQTVVITNTGNASIDLDLSGAALCTDYPTCAGDQIAVSSQEYSLTSFTYGSGTALSGTPTTVNISLAKSTVAPSNSTINLYWGIGLPDPLGVGSYSGANILTAATDN